MVAALICFCIENVHGTDICEDVYPRYLDVGIYWARMNPEGKITWEKSCPDMGFLATAFDFGRNTVIWTHGLQPEFVSKGERFWVENEEMQFLAPWVMMGWNVGIFQWTQFADERLSHFERAEAKIWESKYFADMRYKHLNRHGEVVISDAPRNATVGDLFVHHYLPHARKLLPGTEIRLVGHSLGSQLVVHAAHHLYKMQSKNKDTINIIPHRVAMIDPVYSPDIKGFFDGFECGDTLEKVLGCCTKDLHDAGVAVEYYRFSFINKCIFSSQENNNIIHSSAFSQPTVNLWGDKHLGSCYNDDLLSSSGKLRKEIKSIADQLYNQHIIGVPYYALSLVHPPMRCILSEDEQSCTPLKSLALGAAMPTEAVLDWSHPKTDLNSKSCFHQFDDGTRADESSTMTVDPGDDTFFIRSCTHSHS